MALLAQLPLAGCLLLLIVAALHDIGVRTVPDSVSLLLAVLGAALRCRSGDAAAGLAAAAIVFVLAAFAWRRGWMGGGDVKLFGGAALAVGPFAVANFLLAASLAGGVLALLYLGLARLVPAPAAMRPQHLLPRMLRAEQWRLRRSGPLPYASAIAAGAVFTLTQG